MAELLSHCSGYCRTLQYEWSVLDAPILQREGFRIHHRALTNNFRLLHSALSQRTEVCQRWSDAVGFDLSRADDLAHLMLKASLVMNPASVILFSSKRPQHIEANVRAADDAALEPAARRLYELVHSEREQLLPRAEAEAR